jgi:crotonobetainyl-CoA:carnitine CoA-transferase CaiB-like acyl-CoA transferase
MTRLFEGLKVLDCGSFIAAPAAATILSDFGADVIKIEPPGAGDPYRAIPKLPASPQSDENYAWMLASRNKRGLALDLGKPAAREVICRLISTADIFITNFPLAVRKKFRLNYADLALLNERLIYASFTGYGERGEEANKPGFDITAWWARSGLMDGVRTEAKAPPARPLTGMGDHPSGISLYASIVMALYQRQITGKGAYVGTSLIANGLWSNGVMAQAA